MIGHYFFDRHFQRAEEVQTIHSSGILIDILSVAIDTSHWKTYENFSCL
jgi:hypothetical protein